MADDQRKEIEDTRKCLLYMTPDGKAVRVTKKHGATILNAQQWLLNQTLTDTITAFSTGELKDVMDLLDYSDESADKASQNEDDDYQAVFHPALQDAASDKVMHIPDQPSLDQPSQESSGGAPPQGSSTTCTNQLHFADIRGRRARLLNLYKNRRRNTFTASILPS